MTDVLTEGNAAKLYCLNWIERYAQDRNSLTILDLGCGVALNFVRLLEKYPHIYYLGIEPSAAACEQARKNTDGLNATILRGYAYNIHGNLIEDQFDLITSFSVFEHVYRRLEYLRTVKACLKPEGYALLNYDAGHFAHPASLRERVKNLVGPLLAQFGAEQYYQSFVREADFRNLVTKARLTILEARSFNTGLKGIYKYLHERDRAAFMEHWLGIENWLNERNIAYDDPRAKHWLTRNFILTHGA
jgi:SAM-dependent methyltransferase